MSPSRYTQRSCNALGAALAVAASTAFADTSATQPSVPDTPMKLAMADSTATMSTASDSTSPYIYPSSEAALRRALAEGPVALHLYIYRTRMIYNYYIYDFAKAD